MTDRAKKSWKLQMGQTLALRTASHITALRTEVSPEFPGVDIDAIHYKRGAVRDGLRRPETPMQKLNRIAASIRALEPA